MIRRLIQLHFCTIVLLSLSAFAHAADLTLAWDPPAGTAPAGYYVRYGAWPGAVTHERDAGSQTTLMVTGLVPGTTYEFHVVAYDLSGLRSGPSNYLRVTVGEGGGSDSTSGGGPASGLGGGSDTTSGGGPASEPYRMYLAEGTQGGIFATRLSLANPHHRAVTATIHLRPSPGTQPRAMSVTVPPLSHVDAEPSAMLGGESASFGIEVTSSARLGVSRTMTFDRASGGHSELATATPSRRWYFAEGATHGRFELFYLLFNPGTTTATVSMTYLLPSGAMPARHLEIPPGSRLTVWVDQDGPDLASTDVAAVIESVSGPPIVAERAMYLTGGRGFVGGHVTLGATQPRSRWLMAEGATGRYFSMYILVANPHDEDVTVALNFRTADGTQVRHSVQVPAGSRRTVNVADVDSRLADTAVWTEVLAPRAQPIVAERVMWWPGSTWQDGHAAAGLARTASRWLAVGAQHGGADGHATYLLAANTSSAAQTARVTVLGPSGPVGTTVIRVEPQSRYTIDMAAWFPTVAGTYSVLVEAVGGNGQLIVEHAVYWDAEGVRWAAGTAMPGMPLDE